MDRNEIEKLAKRLDDFAEGDVHEARRDALLGTYPEDQDYFIWADLMSKAAIALRQLLQAQDEVSCNRPETVEQSVSAQAPLQTGISREERKALLDAIWLTDTQSHVMDGETVMINISLLRRIRDHARRFLDQRSQSQIVDADFVQRCSDDLRASLDKFEEAERPMRSEQHGGDDHDR